MLSAVVTFGSDSTAVPSSYILTLGFVISISLRVLVIILSTFVSKCVVASANCCFILSNVVVISFSSFAFCAICFLVTFCWQRIVAIPSWSPISFVNSGYRTSKSSLVPRSVEFSVVSRPGSPSVIIYILFEVSFSLLLCSAARSDGRSSFSHVILRPLGTLILQGLRVLPWSFLASFRSVKKSVVSVGAPSRQP